MEKAIHPQAEHPSKVTTWTGTIWKGISQKSPRREDAGFSFPLSSLSGSLVGEGERASKPVDVVGGGSGWKRVHVTRAGRDGSSAPSSPQTGLVFPWDGVAIVSHENIEAEMAVQRGKLKQRWETGATGRSLTAPLLSPSPGPAD